MAGYTRQRTIADGNTIAAGGEGIVKVYFYNGTNWQQKGTDLSIAGQSNEIHKVSLSNNASVLSISASNNQVKVYAWNGSSWILRDTISGTGGFGSSISFDSTGSSILVSGNKQDIFNLGKNLNPVSMIKSLPEGNSIDHPSGICVGRLGELYITDQSNHSVFWVFKGVASTIYSAPRYKNGDLIEGEPTIPTSIRLNSLEEIIVLFLGDGSIRKFDRKGAQSVLLQSGVIKTPSDIALNDEDELFVVSTLDKKVYKVDGRHPEPDATGAEEDLPSAAEDNAKVRGNYEI